MNSQEKDRNAHGDDLKVRETDNSGDVKHKTFRFGNYEVWDDEVHEAARDFWMEFRVFPGVMLASGATFDRIDAAAKKNNIECFVNSEMRLLAKDSPDAVLSSFDTPFYSLEFAVDDGIGEGSFVLVHDPDAEWEEGPES